MAEDLRHRYAEALAATNTLDDIDLEYTLDQVMAVRDGELEQLKDDALAVVAESAQERDGWRERAEKAELAIARAENLRGKWLAWPEGDMHHAAGLMLAKYLDGTAYGSDEPRPLAALDDTEKAEDG